MTFAHLVSPPLRVSSQVLFGAMLQHEGAIPSRFAYDRPSPKLLGFLRKHYGLSDFVPQQNKFVIFEQFFSNRPVKEASVYDSVKDRPLTARGSAGGMGASRRLGR